MKTLILESADKVIRAEVKVDIFGTNAELAAPGFDTRFTNMEIVDGDAATIAGVNLQEVENSFQSILALAVSTNLNLTVIDIKEPSPLVLLAGPIISAGPDQVGIVNGSGAVALDGTVTSSGTSAVDTILWELLSKTGAGTPVFADATVIDTTITGIDAAEGDYIFKLTVTNVDGLVATDTVLVTVLAA